MNRQFRFDGKAELRVSVDGDAVVLSVKRCHPRRWWHRLFLFQTTDDILMEPHDAWQMAQALVAGAHEIDSRERDMLDVAGQQDQMVH